jgi:hypothetical protein
MFVICLATASLQQDADGVAPIGHCVTTSDGVAVRAVKV